MDERINPFIPTPPDYCRRCNTPHSVEIYNCYDRPIGFSQLLNFKRNIADSSRPTITRAKCRTCGQDYIVCWDSDGVPFTMDEPTKITQFVRSFHDYITEEISEDEIAALKAKRISRNYERNASGRDQY